VLSTESADRVDSCKDQLHIEAVFSRAIVLSFGDTHCPGYNHQRKAFEMTLIGWATLIAFQRKIRGHLAKALLSLSSQIGIQ